MGRIVGIGGRLAAGKDTVADYLVGKGWIKFGMSDPLHEAMLTLNPIVAFGDFTYEDATLELGYTAAKEEYPEYRRLLQAFGTEVGRNLFGTNVWSDIMKRRASQAAEGGHDVIVTGIRFPNELEAIQELGGELWWVTRNGHSYEDTHGGVGINTHASENSVSADDFDVVIINNTTFEDLYREVDIYR